MALSIKDDYADALAREISQITGESITTAVTKALEKQLDYVKKKTRSKAERAAILAEVARIQTSVKARYKGKRIPSSKELCDSLYDEYGLPK